jgi:DNA invertase Pin-like site-specific DNA recombinase
MTAFIAYLRVSTAKQGESGLGLEAQQAAIAKHVGHATLLKTYTEIESGSGAIVRSWAKRWNIAS